VRFWESTILITCIDTHFRQKKKKRTNRSINNGTNRKRVVQYNNISLIFKTILVKVTIITCFHRRYIVIRRYCLLPSPSPVTRRTFTHRNTSTYDHNTTAIIHLFPNLPIIAIFPPAHHRRIVLYIITETYLIHHRAHWPRHDQFINIYIM
jgi:hypothetical protein